MFCYVVGDLNISIVLNCLFFYVFWVFSVICKIKEYIKFYLVLNIIKCKEMLLLKILD